MDPARFDAAYRRGAAFSIDELVVFALDGVERILAERAPAIRATARPGIAAGVGSG
jgi:hypothetical protein